MTSAPTATHQDEQKLLPLAKVGRYGPDFYLYLCRRELIGEQARQEIVAGRAALSGDPT